MGVFGGPNVSEGGLVLALDGANYKSFKGEGTTNLIPNADVMSGWSPYSSGNDGTFTTEFGTTGYRIINRPSWNGIYQGITLPSTGTYTLSAWFRYWGGSADNNGATVYTNGGGIGDVAASLDKSKVGVWQRVTMTQTYSTTSIGFFIISYGGTNAVSTWDVTMPQIEAKSYATTFTTGTRGTTVATGGGWADLSANGNNGELVNGVRESSANLGALVFDGSNDYVDCGKTATQFGVYDADYTFDAWVYPTNLDSDKTMFGTDQTASRQGLHLVFRSGAIYQGHYGADFSAGSATLNAWNNISYTYVKSSGLASIYKNGVLQGSGTISSFIGTTNILIGRWASAAYFSGTGSNYKVYNRALTAAEIQQNFNATRSRYSI